MNGDDPALATERNIFKQSLKDSRWAVLLLCAIFGFVAIFSLCGFAFQALYRYPTGEWFFPNNRLWVLSHLVRGVCLSLLCAKLLRYAAAINRFAAAPEKDLSELGQEHASLWQTAAWTLGIIFCYSMASANYL
jgi:amino acid transporter